MGWAKLQYYGRMGHVAGGPPLEFKGEDLVAEYIRKIPPPIRWALAIAISVPAIASSYMELVQRLASTQLSQGFLNWLQLAPVAGNLCLVMVLCFLAARPPATSTALPRATETVDAFVGMWRSFWAVGFAYYVFLLIFFAPLVRVDSPSGPQYGPIAASSPYAFIITNSILNATGIFFSIFLASMYVYLRQRIDARRIKHVFMPIFLVLLIPQIFWILIYWQQPESMASYLSGQAKFAPTMALDLFYNCVFAMSLALFVSRFGSRLFGSRVRHVLYLNFYVVLQVAYAVHEDMGYQGKWIVGIVAFVVVAFLKILLFSLVQSQLTSGRMLYYVDKMREVDEETDREWQDFARKNAIVPAK